MTRRSWAGSRVATVVALAMLVAACGGGIADFPGFRPKITNESNEDVIVVFENAETVDNGGDGGSASPINTYLVKAGAVDASPLWVNMNWDTGGLNVPRRDDPARVLVFTKACTQLLAIEIKWGESAKIVIKADGTAERLDMGKGDFLSSPRLDLTEIRCT